MCIFSFCLTYCVCVSFSLVAGLYFPLFLVSAPVSKVGSVGCVGFLVEGTGACVLVDEAGSYLSVGQDRVWWCVLHCL